MTATAPAPFVKPPNASSTVDHKPQVPKVTSIKTIAESPNLKSVPSQFACTTNPFEHADPNDPQFSVPIIDYSLLTSISPEQRSKTIHDLANICQDWGFFMLINHGVPERLMKGMIDVCHKFFQLPEEDKKKLETSYGVDPEKDKSKLKTNFGLDPIKYGTGGNIWRDYIQVIVYPEFHTLDKPAEFREVSLEFTKRTREVALEVMKAISESLGLEADYIYKAMNLERGLQLMAANYYPPCPQPELTVGMNYHTDPGMVTFLIDNEISGLQVEHNGKWVTVNSIPNAYLVNLSDHLQILTNKKYKSVMHQASVNNKATRISVAVPHWPSLDTLVGPAPELLEKDGKPPIYSPMDFRDYIKLRQSGKFYMKSSKFN